VPAEGVRRPPPLSIFEPIGASALAPALRPQFQGWFKTTGGVSVLETLNSLNDDECRFRLSVMASVYRMTKICGARRRQRVELAGEDSMRVYCARRSYHCYSSGRG